MYINVERKPMTMALFYRLLTTLLVFITLHLATSFTQEKPKWSCRQTAPAPANVLLSAAHSFEAPPHDEIWNTQWDRRSVVGSLGLVAMGLCSATLPASAMLPYDLGCLLDLPPVDDDSVRIYLCRHAQTENNRLRLVQGARVDPPINYNGIQQSLRLGSALSRLEDNCPSLLLHSNLIRSKETAEYAARNIVDKTVELAQMSYLGEVDFGSIAEGKPVSDARGGMIRTFGSWAAGFVDTRGEGDGESGREVMNRAATALGSMVKLAEANGGEVAAIAHSKFLKVLLAVLEDAPLVQGAAMQQSNCCIDVIDMKRDAPSVILGPKCNLFGGPLSNAPNDFELQVPAGKVVRVNEKRHLEDLEFETMVA